MSIVRENIGDADWLHLSDNEAVRWSGRPSLHTLVPEAVAAIVLVILGIGLSRRAQPYVSDQGWPLVISYLPILLALAGIALIAYAFLHWLRLLYVITDEEIYVKIGLVSRDVTQVPLTRVQNATYDQSVLERFLSYGTVQVFTAGTNTDDLILESVPDPEEVMKTLSTHVSEMQTGDRGAV